jgi:8-oxo-dGTP diphosphatase
MKTIAVFNTENVSGEEAKDFHARKAVRIVVFDNDKNIAVIHSHKPNFYTLPGGGTEKGESLQQAAIRECKEEIGCDVAIQSEIGLITEYRKRENLIKESYCYLACIIEEKGESPLFDDGLRMSTVWVSIGEAIGLIKSSDKPTSYLAEFAAQRDVNFLEQAKGSL